MYYWLLMNLGSGPALPASSYQDGGAAARHNALVSPMAAKQYPLCGGLRATVKGQTVLITNAKGVVVAQNKQLIRLPDEHTDCPSEGFERLVSKGNYFTIEQQNCGGWFFINEYITFYYVPGTGKIQLHKVSFSVTDRREPDKKIPDKVFTKKQFGQRYFNRVTLDSLELLNR
jgi:hypothetical protein